MTAGAARRLVVLACLCAAAACTAPVKTGTPFEELTIQNLAVWPDGREYITVKGQGYPGDGQKEAELRRSTARDAALMAAQEKMIVELKRVAPREKIRDLLRQSEVAKIDYAYDDICTVTLRLPKEALAKKENPW